MACKKNKYYKLSITTFCKVEAECVSDGDKIYFDQIELDGTDAVLIKDTDIDRLEEGFVICPDGMSFSEYIQSLVQELCECKLKDGGNVEPEVKEPVKELIEYCVPYTDNNEEAPEKLKNQVDVSVWFDGTTICHTLMGEVPNGIALGEQGSNLINIENYTKMSYETRLRGRLIENSPVLPTPEPFPGTLTFCLAAATDLDIVDSIEASASYAAFIAKLPVLPDGLSYGLTQIKGTKIEGQKGMTVDCDLTGATDTPLGEDANTQGSFVTPYDANNDVLPGGTTGIVAHPLKTFEFIDGENCIPCYDEACKLVTGDHTANNGTAAGAWDYSFCVGCFGTPPAGK